jgi:hypothetical protein
MGLLLMTGLRRWRRRPVPGARVLFTAGLIVTYLMLPLLHYLAFTDGYYYITSASNYFARNVPLQIVTWLVAAALAIGATRLRTTLATGQTKAGLPL